MAISLGPRANQVYEALRRSIAGGELPPGTKLPAHTELAQQYGVAPLTMRTVLGRLEARGLVSREQGATPPCAPAPPRRCCCCRATKSFASGSASGSPTSATAP